MRPCLASQSIPSLWNLFDTQTISSLDIVMRTIVDIPKEQINALDRYSKKHGVSRAETVRRAIDAFLPRPKKNRESFRQDPAFGSWKKMNVDSVEYIRSIRSEWDQHE
jgi:hypothetical protein